MAKNSIEEWDADAANNTDLSGVGIVGSSAVSNFDNALRVLMAQVATARLIGGGFAQDRSTSEKLRARQNMEAAAIVGDTFTGDIGISKSSPQLLLTKPATGTTASISSLTGANLRWKMDLGDSAAESGGSAGSDFYLRAFNDAGSQSGVPLTIQRNTTTLVTDRDFVSGKANPSLILNKTTGASTITSQLNSSARWQIDLGDGSPESGGNAGSDVYWRRYSDAGSQIGIALSINRSSGATSIGGNVAVAGSLSKGSGTFLIDHPLKPETHDLAHGFVEAPRYELIYRGTAKLVKGKAKIDIDAASDMTPGTFAALTINATVTSLQNQSGFARVRPGPIVGGKFDIICEDTGSTDVISWTVIAERNDPFVKAIDDNCDEDGRFIPEREKEEA